MKFFNKDTIGKQFVRSVDSILSNIAEGFGRQGKKDKIIFYRYARASVYESLDWLQKAKIRNLINKTDYEYIFEILESLPKEIDQLLASLIQK